MFEFVLDTREHQLAKILNIKTGNLDLGDFNVVEKESNQIKMIVERKTVQDFAQSIKDKRYHEQKVRILSYRAASNPCLKVIYIIEGHFSYEPMFQCQSITSKTFTTCILGCLLRDGIHILNTKNVSETSELLLSIMERIETDPEKYLSETSVSYQPYHTLVKTKKKDNIDPQTCLLLQVSNIPGISHKKAEAIVHHFDATSMNELIEKVKTHDLSDVPGVGKVLARTITQYLIGE